MRSNAELELRSHSTTASHVGLSPHDCSPARDEQVVKRYAYHPDHENRARCVGNDSSHLCLKCGEQFLIDSEAPLKRCPACAANSIVDAFHLEGKACPFCKTGMFRDSGCYAIS